MHKTEGTAQLAKDEFLNDFKLHGRVAWVTGGNRGLGYEIARGLASVGATVIISGRTPDRTKQAADQISNDTGVSVTGLVGDVTSSDDVESYVRQIVSQHGRVDILVNNAGWGRIINVGSMMGITALAERTAYCASKGGVHMVTKALALELVSYGINVNAIAPGPFLTEINAMAKENPEMNQFFMDRVPMGRWGEPREVVGAVIYLASEASRFVTGSVMTIDGGWTIQ